MTTTKFEDCQTRRFHENCNPLHSLKILSTDDKERQNVPLLSLVNAFIRYLDNVDPVVVFPTHSSSITCRGEMVVMGTRVANIEQTAPIHSAYSILFGSSIDKSIEAKDKLGYSLNFRGLFNQYIQMIIDANSINEIRSALIQFRDRLHEFE